ncbi:MAG: extracellular solute-binding protein [Nodosilinea sp.]
MNRRTFLASTAGLSLALAAGCQRAVADVTVAMLEGSVPVPLIKTFQRQQMKTGQVGITAMASLLKLFTLLQTWQTQTQAASSEPSPSARSAPPPANWVTLGDYWLAPAIQQGLIQPIDVAPLPNWADLPPVWSPLVQRNPQGNLAPAASVWGIPYRWSSLGILYDSARLKAKDTPLATWQDLLHPDLTRRVILPDHPRLVIGLGLQAMGASANVENPSGVNGLEDFLQALHGQVRTYSSDRYLEPLMIGDVTAVVGWAKDMLPALQQRRTLRLVSPPAGTLASADLWVQPQATPLPSALANAWLNFCLGGDFATQMAIYSQGLSPRLWGIAAGDVPEVLQSQQGVLAATSEPASSEFLHPLSDAAQTSYGELWQRLRQPGTATG